MGEGYRLAAAPASSSVQPEFEAFVVAPDHACPVASERPLVRLVARSRTQLQRQEQKGDARCPPRDAHSRSTPSASPTLLSVLVLTALGVIAHAAFI